MVNEDTNNGRFQFGEDEVFANIVICFEFKASLPPLVRVKR